MEFDIYKHGRLVQKDVNNYLLIDLDDGHYKGKVALSLTLFSSSLLSLIFSKSLGFLSFLLANPSLIISDGYRLATLTELAARLEDISEILQINTDGIYVRVKTIDDVDTVKAIAKEWEDRTKLELEFDISFYLFTFSINNPFIQGS